MKPEEIQEIFRKIKEEQPVIHMIPNGVSASLCADGLSALGVRPLMAVAPQEMEEIVAQADGVVVNLGQLTLEKREAAQKALRAAEKEEKSVVLDPVGCGASAFRLKTVQELLEISWRGIIKGNRSEIYSIQRGILTREGIDALKERGLIENVLLNRTLLVSGEADKILGAEGIRELEKKKERRQNIVGTGCLLGAVAGACHSVELKPERAAQAAAEGMRYALEQSERSKGYGQAKSILLDALEMLKENVFLDWMKGRDE